MIQILLVDDDPFFLTMFQGLVDWESFGCTIAYQAENGQQAISILSQHAVDVMITDMVMPVMGGVELIRHVRRHYPHIKCFALSSFDDFDYVRQSLREGAQDYLLKHAINRTVIEELLSSLSPKGPVSAQADSRNVFRDLMITMIESGEIQPDWLKSTIQELNVDFPNPPLMILSIRIHDITSILKRFEFKDRYRQFLFTTTNIVQGALERYGQALCMCNDYDTIYAVVSNHNFASRLYGTQVSHLVKKNVSSILNRYCNISVSISINCTCNTLEDILPAFQKMEDELALQTDPDYLHEKDTNTPVISIRLEAEQAISEWMTNGSFEDIQRLIQEEFELCHNQSPYRNAIQHISMEFINLLNRICRDQKISLDLMFASDASPYSTVSRITSYAETVNFITKAFLALYTHLHSGEPSGNLIVQNALRVIRSHYTQDLSLSTLADAIHCNPTYLSRVFKSETGKGFVQYLNDYRLAKAQQLMDRETIPLRFIAQRVGFPNYNYFARIFKQKYGQTPRNYISKRMKNDD